MKTTQTDKATAIKSAIEFCRSCMAVQIADKAQAEHAALKNLETIVRGFAKHGDMPAEIVSALGSISDLRTK